MDMWQKSFLVSLALLLSAVFCGCSMDTHVVTEEYYDWSFVGIRDDSTAVVMASLNERGYIDCHHLISWEDGEDFNREVSSAYYAVRMDKLQVGRKNSSSEMMLAEKSKYQSEFIWLDESNHDCGFLISKDKNVLDTLELDGCVKEMSGEILGNYLKVDGNLYAISGGKFLSQSPTYRIVDKGRNIIFENSVGDQVVYSGAP